MAARLPPGAAADLVEWGPATSAEGQFALTLDRELSVSAIVSRMPGVRPLTDDTPVNEYFFLRRRRQGQRSQDLALPSR